MIFKTYYHLPAHQAPVTSPAMQPYDMLGGHRDREHNPPGATKSTDKGEDLVFQIEVGMDHEASQVAARHFELAMFRQQQGTTAKSTDWRGNYPHLSTLPGKPENSIHITSHHPREGCGQPVTARGDVD